MTTCETCRFHSFGQCHRYPPVLRRLMIHDKHVFIFPDVGAGDWCGEYSKNSAARSLRRKGGRPNDVAEQMQQIIRDAGRPMTRGEIVAAFEARDIPIPFEDKARYVGTIAWRHKGTFVNIEGRGYWLRDQPTPKDPAQ